MKNEETLRTASLAGTSVGTSRCDVPVRQRSEGGTSAVTNPFRKDVSACLTLRSGTGTAQCTIPTRWNGANKAIFCQKMAKTPSDRAKSSPDQVNSVTESTGFAPELTKSVTESTRSATDLTRFAMKSTKSVAESTKFATKSTESVAEATRSVLESTESATESTGSAPEATEFVTDLTKSVTNFIRKMAKITTWRPFAQIRDT